MTRGEYRLHVLVMAPFSRQISRYKKVSGLFLKVEEIFIRRGLSKNKIHGSNDQ